MTIYKTLGNVVIPDGTQLPNEFLMIEDGKATLVTFTSDDVTFSPFAADLLAIVEGTYVPVKEAEKQVKTIDWYIQAIDEAYKRYTELFYDINASREAQEAQFAVYEALRNASVAQ